MKEKRLVKPSKLDSWTMNGLSSSIKKRLEETIKGMNVVTEKLKLGELQPLYNRLLNDRENLYMWNELSFDMMTYESSKLKRHQNRYRQTEFTSARRNKNEDA